MSGDKEEALGSPPGSPPVDRSAFVLGYTGEVGKEVVKELAARNAFSRVVLIGRRQVEYEDKALADMTQSVVDFEKLDEHSDVFKGSDVGFCCLGTTRGKSGADGFVRVDHDYVMQSAKLAKAQGCKQFHVVSSQGANKNSSFLYPKVKGEVEEELKSVGFESLVIYRPGILMCNRTERRPFESVARFVMRPLAALFPTSGSVPTSIVARAMVQMASDAASQHGVTTLENKDIHRVGGEAKKTQPTQ